MHSLASKQLLTHIAGACTGAGWAFLVLFHESTLDPRRSACSAKTEREIRQKNHNHESEQEQSALPHQVWNASFQLHQFPPQASLHHPVTIHSN
jgi:hypothetical protein